MICRFAAMWRNKHRGKTGIRQIEPDKKAPLQHFAERGPSQKPITFFIATKRREAPQAEARRSGEISGMLVQIPVNMDSGRWVGEGRLSAGKNVRDYNLLVCGYAIMTTKVGRAGLSKIPVKG